MFKFKMKKIKLKVKLIKINDFLHLNIAMKSNH